MVTSSLKVETIGTYAGFMANGMTAKFISAIWKKAHLGKDGFEWSEDGKFVKRKVVDRRENIVEYLNFCVELYRLEQNGFRCFGEQRDGENSPAVAVYYHPCFRREHGDLLSFFIRTWGYREPGFVADKTKNGHHNRDNHKYTLPYNGAIIKKHRHSPVRESPLVYELLIPESTPQDDRSKGCDDIKDEDEVKGAGDVEIFEADDSYEEDFEDDDDFSTDDDEFEEMDEDDDTFEWDDEDEEDPDNENADKDESDEYAEVEKIAEVMDKFAIKEDTADDADDEDETRYFELTSETETSDEDCGRYFEENFTEKEEVKNKEIVDENGAVKIEKEHDAVERGKTNITGENKGTDQTNAKDKKEMRVQYRTDADKEVEKNKEGDETNVNSDHNEKENEKPDGEKWTDHSSKASHKEESRAEAHSTLGPA